MKVPSCTLRQTLAFIRDPADFTAGEGLTLGALYRVRIPGYRIRVVTSPDLAERILVRDADHFVKGRIYWSELRRTIGDSIGSMDGERWGYLHAVERSYFSPKAVGGYGPVLQRHTDQCAEALELGLDSKPDVTVLDTFVRLNAGIVLSALFGRDQEARLGELTSRIADGHEMIAWGSKYPWRSLTGFFNGVRARTNDHRRFFDGYVADLRSERGPGDSLLHALLGIEGDSGAPEYTESLLRNEIVFHLGASTETQAAAEAWTLYLLWKHPTTLERVRAEVDAVAERGSVHVEHLPELKATRRVVQEALRLYPPVYGIVRDCDAEVDLGTHRARPGDSYLISVYGLHRDPRVWGQPDSFLPERFSPPDADEIGRYDYIPFGAGNHVCIGQHLAMAAMVLTIGQLAHRFDWTFSDRDVKPVASPSLKPSGDFTARFTVREHAGTRASGSV